MAGLWRDYGGIMAFRPFSWREKGGKRAVGQSLQYEDYL